MTVYTYAQLEQLWINAGGPAAVAPLAAAVAEAESRGNSAAENKTDNNGTQTSWGLWQISNGTHSQPVANILDPNVNAAAAVAKWKAAGGSFSPDWGTYDSGAYKAYLSNSIPPDPNIPAATLASSTTSNSSGGGADNPSSCLIGGGEGGVFGIGAASFCLLDKSQARAMIGAGLLVAAVALIALPGIILLGAAGFRRAGAGPAAQAAGPLEAVPGYGRVITAARSRAPSPQPFPAAPRSQRKVRTQRGQVSQDFADRYGTA